MSAEEAPDAPPETSPVIRTIAMPTDTSCRRRSLSRRTITPSNTLTSGLIVYPSAASVTRSELTAYT